MNILTEVYTCQCKLDFNWKNKNTYKNHFKSKKHKLYETINQEINHRKNITKLQIKYEKLNREHEQIKKMFLNVLYKNDESDSLLN